MFLAVADDDQFWRNRVRAWVTGLSAPAIPRVETFAAPEALIDHIEQNIANIVGDAVVFLDLDFDDNLLTGIEALRRLKNHPDHRIRTIPIIIYSNSDGEREIQTCYDSAANSYVHKGDHTEEEAIFLDTVQYWMDVSKLPAKGAPAKAPPP